jgi:hypothetical protein
MTLRFTAVAGGVDVRLGRRELAVLGALPAFLATVGVEAGDPAIDRLFPAAYQGEADDRDFRRFAAPEIERARDVDRDVFSDVLERLRNGEAHLTTDEAESCMRTVGAARIAIAARNGLFDEDRFQAASRTPEGTIVAFLGVVQDEFVAALTQLGEGRDG